MLQLPDLETLRLCSMVATTTFAAVFAALWCVRRSETALLYWSANQAVYGVALLFFGIISHDSWIGTSVLLILLAFSNILVLAGIRRFEGMRPYQAWMLVPLLLPALAYTVAGALPASTNPGTAFLRSGIEAIGLLLSITMIAGATLLGFPERPNWGRRIAGIALFGYVPAYLAAMVIGAIGVEPHEMIAVFPLLADQVLLGMLSLALLSMPGERARDQLREAVLRDPLTGAWNRAGLTAAQARLLVAGTVVVAIDIDHFKAINDRLGHNAGDQVLITLSHHACRLADNLDGAFARVGGDEFIAILPPGADAHDFADQLCALGRRHPLEHGAWTISIGLALVEAGDSSFHDARNRADGRLYQAKAAGRDQIAA